MNVTLAQISVEDLQPRLRELVDVIGLPATIKLVQRRGGRRIKIPNKPKMDRLLVGIVGEAATAKMIRYYGAGAIVEIDRGVQALHAVRDRQFYADAETLSGNQLAEKYAMTARHVWRKLKKRGMVHTPQGSLWN